MKTKRNFLNVIVKRILLFAAVVGILAGGATLSVLAAFQVSRTPGLVFAGAAGLALLYFGVNAAIKAYKVRGAAGFLSRPMTPKLKRIRCLSARIGWENF